jgi:hypothetical protein
MGQLLGRLVFGLLIIFAVTIQYYYIQSKETIDIIEERQSNIIMEQQELLDKMESFMNKGSRYIASDADEDKEHMLMLIESVKTFAHVRFDNLENRILVLEKQHHVPKQ